MLKRRPTLETIQCFIEEQSRLELTYSCIGETNGTTPPGYVVDHNRFRIGTGDKVFASARAALERWQQFGLTWLTACPTTTPIREGNVIALCSFSLGCWWLNACKIVYVIDAGRDSSRFGFAYGTLPAHAVSGEERFMLEIDDEGTVWYDILAFSRPQRLLSYIGYPYLRHLQKRFARESAEAMQCSVAPTQSASRRHQLGQQALKG